MTLQPIFIIFAFMITQEQLKETAERTEALHRYLDIDSKKIEVEEE